MTKTIKSSTLPGLEKAINAFIEQKDIKFPQWKLSHPITTSGTVQYSANISYKLPIFKTLRRVLSVRG